MNKYKKTVHLVGIGGIGISALARFFLSKGWVVSGSDLVASKITKKLTREGVRIFVCHKKTNVPPNSNILVYNQAIPSNNPEIVEARRRKIPCLSYPEAVGILTRTYATIAIAGAHGKSTTAALMGLILKNAGLDPTIIVGTELKELGGKNFRAGKHADKNKYLVLEADEWRASFLNYSPALSIITNIDREHLDFYRNLGDIKKTFLKFMARTKPGGALVLNKDSAALASRAPRQKNIAREKNLRVAWYSTKSSIAQKIRKVIKIPGEHNISNALGAYTAAQILGIPTQKIFQTISTYTGSWRRFEYRGELWVTGQESRVTGQESKIPIFDDYAHHPTEIKATLAAFKEKFPDRNLICVFQPHQAKRLRALFKEFVHAFDAADTTLIAPFYDVAGRDEKISPRLEHVRKPSFVATGQDFRAKTSEARGSLSRLGIVLSLVEGRGIPVAIPTSDEGFGAEKVGLLAPIRQTQGALSLYRRAENGVSGHALDSPALVRAMQKRHTGKPIFYVANLKNIKNALTAIIAKQIARNLPQNAPLQKVKPAVIVMMGAGDIFEYTGALIDKKQKEE